MIPGQLEKLTKLIHSSPILNFGEKAEWLSLLGLMTDNQVGELEKILTAASLPAQPKQPAPSFDSPKLSHILNLPKMPLGGANQPGPAPAPKPSPLPGSGNFAQKLSAIVAEKELPPPASKQGLAQPPSVAPQKQPVQSFAQQKPPALVLKPTPPPALPKMPLPLSKPPQIPQMPAAPIPLKTQPPKTLQPLKLDSLEDLGTLTDRILKESDLNSLLSKVKNLIDRHGYYEVLFNIEKSPLFQTYIQTGMNLLNNQGDFDAPEGSQKGLARQDFEKMADLLMKIQAE